MNKRDTFYFWYFILHIPITLLVDSTIVIPQEYQLSLQKAFLGFHLAQNKDFLLEELPLWLRVSGAFEVFVQLPIFFAAAWSLRRGCSKIYVVMTVYGFNAFFTTLLCLCYVYSEAEGHGLSSGEMYQLLALYVPYFAIPLFMMVDCGKRVMEIVGKQERVKKD